MVTEVTGVEDEAAAPVISNVVCMPNPFNNSMAVSCDLTEPALIQMDVYNVKGQHVRTLANSIFNKGSQKIDWDGRDETGLSVGAGVYIIRIKSAGLDKAVKVMRE